MHLIMILLSKRLATNYLKYSLQNLSNLYALCNIGNVTIKRKIIYLHVINHTRNNYLNLIFIDPLQCINIRFISYDINFILKQYC